MGEKERRKRKHGRRKGESQEWRLEPSLLLILALPRSEDAGTRPEAMEMQTRFQSVLLQRCTNSWETREFVFPNPKDGRGFKFSEKQPSGGSFTDPQPSCCPPRGQLRKGGAMHEKELGNKFFTFPNESRSHAIGPQDSYLQRVAVLMVGGGWHRW